MTYLSEIRKFQRCLRTRFCSYNHLSKIFFAIIIFLLFGKQAFAQSGSTRQITVSIQPASLHPGDNFTLSFNINKADSVYFFGLKLAFDASLISFVSSQSDALMGQNAIQIANTISSDTLGASTSRISGMASGNGSLFKLTFQINKNDAPGLLSFKISQIDLRDSTGNSIDANFSAEIDTSITPAITNARLFFSDDSLITGQNIAISSGVLSRGVTDQSGKGDGIKAWIGFSPVNSDPSTWNDTAWVASNYTRDDGVSDDYQCILGSNLPVGTYYVAARFQLNSQNYVYAGYSTSGGGIWDGSTYKSGTLTVKNKPPYRTKLVVWNFNDDNFIADKGIQANRQDTLRISGAHSSGWITGDGGDALNTNGWDAINHSEYYEIHISTKYYKNLLVSSEQSGSGTGPRDFILEYSLDNQSWSPIPDSEITVGNSWTSGVLSRVALPSATWDKSDLYLRWEKSSQVDIAGDTSISSQGTNRIDNIMVSGIDKNPVQVSVWPGDTDQNGVVDETDVLKLGEYWELEGPPRQDSSSDWHAKTAIGWRPAKATYADADGNGVVDESDLFPIGKNYNHKEPGQGKIVSSSKNILAFSHWPEMQKGDQLKVTVETMHPVKIKGLAYRFALNNVSSRYFKLGNSQSGSWAHLWSDHHQLLSFIQQQSMGASGAWVHKGVGIPATGTDLFSFTIDVKNSSFRTAQLDIQKISILNSAIRNLSPDSLVVSVKVNHPTAIDKSPQIVRRTKLDKNYPNPFNPTTNIQYELANRTKIKLTIYDLLGRRVAVLVNKIQTMGKYTVTWNASSVASGLYFYQLKTGNKVYTRKMILVK